MTDDWAVVREYLEMGIYLATKTSQYRDEALAALARLRERDHELLNTQEVYGKQIIALREREAQLADRAQEDADVMERARLILLARAEAAEAEVRQVRRVAQIVADDFEGRARKLHEAIEEFFAAQDGYRSGSHDDQQRIEQAFARLRALAHEEETSGT